MKTEKPMKTMLRAMVHFMIRHKHQMLASGLMIVLGVGTAAGSYLYVPRQIISAEQEAPASPETTAAPLPETAAAGPPEAKEQWQPVLGELNLAHYFPEDAESEEIADSLAGEAFRVLMNQDEDWIGDIYDFADETPASMASRLGIAHSRIMGRYNPKDDRHQADNPDSWTINTFKSTRLTARDGDGNSISPYSNVIEILSLASVYTYYAGADDYDLFLSYASQLWKASHSYSVSMSSVYYCSGCLSEADEQRQLEELENEAIAEEASYQESDLHDEAAHADEEEDLESDDETSAAPEEATTGLIISGETEAMSATAETVSEESSADDDLSATPSDAVSAAEAARKAITSALENVIPDSELTDYACPGHVDLVIQLKIAGLDGSNNLFSLDPVGNDPEAAAENWPGWNEETMAAARQLAECDWFDRYGLSISTIAVGTPLTPEEIEAYMAHLSPDLSQTRKDIVRFALESVGRIPYYWGGKASYPEYEGNHFGTFISADMEGRVLKGLDCSGWINWVYWSVTGSRLSYESTAGLAAIGTPIKRSELQPGDIVVRTGEDAHVIMFLGWTSDGQILCVHESSTAVNNVTVATRDANWPYYRKLID